LILQANFGAGGLINEPVSQADRQANCPRRFNCNIRVGQDFTAQSERRAHIGMSATLITTRKSIPVLTPRCKSDYSGN
jgi:hypothetical protein